MRFRTVITALAAVLAILPFKAGAQGSGKDNVFGGIVRLDRTIHDFGDIMVSDGPMQGSPPGGCCRVSVHAMRKFRRAATGLSPR